MELPALSDQFVMRTIRSFLAAVEDVTGIAEVLVEPGLGDALFTVVVDDDEFAVGRAIDAALRPQVRAGVRFAYSIVTPAAVHFDPDEHVRIFVRES